MQLLLTEPRSMNAGNQVQAICFGLTSDSMRKWPKLLHQILQIRE